MQTKQEYKRKGLSQCKKCGTPSKSFLFKESKYLGHHYELWGCPKCKIGAAHDTTIEEIEEAKITWSKFNNYE